MIADAEIKLLKVAKVKCQRSLLFCTRYLYKHTHNRKFTVLKHHEQLAEALERVLSGKCRRLLISMPPRYGKTELAVKNFMAHALAINPAAKFIHLSASDTLALDNSEGTQDIVKSAAYQQLFPEVQIKRSSDSKKKWYTTAGGGVYATSASGQVTGFGAGQTETEEDEDDLDGMLSEFDVKQEFGGAIIIDDPIKPDDADSDVRRERVNRKWSSTIKSRVNSRNTPVIVIMQRLHPLDMIGYLQATEPGEWETVNMPALYTDEDGTQQCLDPSKHTVQDLLDMEKSEDEDVRIMFQRQYQQNPRPREGLLFPEDELHYYNPATVDVDKLAEYRFAFIDPADEGGDDLSAPAGYLIGNKVYVTDVIYNKDGTDVNEPACIEFIKRHKCNAVQVESNSAWILFAKAVRNKLQETESECGLRIIKNTANKHTRILAQAAFVKMHFVFRSDWQTCSRDYRRFMQNLMDYRTRQEGINKNAHDDAPDSIAGMAKYFKEQFAHLW